MENTETPTKAPDPLAGFTPRAELAKQIGRSERTLARWERLRIGPPVTRIGRLILYDDEEFRAWLKAQGGE